MARKCSIRVASCSVASIWHSALHLCDADAGAARHGDHDWRRPRVAAQVKAIAPQEGASR